MDNTWILVANASTANLYNYLPSSKNSGKPTLTLIEAFSHPASRKKDSELASDREGAYISDGGHGNFSETSDPHQYEAVVFARELVKKLEQGRVAHQYHALILVAGPPFLGLLRSQIDEHPLKNIPTQEVQKEYINEKPQSLMVLLNLK